MISDRMKKSHTRGTATTAPWRGESSLQCFVLGANPVGARTDDVDLRHGGPKRASIQSTKILLTVPVHYRRERTRAKF